MKNRSLKIILISFFTCVLFLQSVQADLIETTDGKKSFGQLISVTKSSIFIETIIKNQLSLQTIALPRNKIQSVTDETGKVLFSDNKVLVDNLLTYENIIRNNWEELKFRFKNSVHDSVFLINGEKFAGKIITITESELFLERPEKRPNSTKILVTKFFLKQIRRINNEPVIFVDPSKPVRTALKKIKYPVYSLNLGLSFVRSGYNDLQDLFQDFYNSQDIDAKAAKRLEDFIGIQLKIEMMLNSYLSLGLTAHYFDYPKINTLGLTMAEVKYIFHSVPMRPWIGLGVAGQDFSSREKAGGSDFTWRTSKSTISIGTGISSGGPLGYGFTFSAHYLPFGKEKTKIDETGSLLSRKINFSMIMISLGARFNFN